MGERCNRTAEVRGSIPLGSTNKIKHLDTIAHEPNGSSKHLANKDVGHTWRQTATALDIRLHGPGRRQVRGESPLGSTNEIKRLATIDK